MRKNQIDRRRGQGGFTLILSIVVAGIVLAIGLSLLSIALKQFKISSIGLDSEMAFQAANAGVECIKFWDNSWEQGGKFDVGASSDEISCFGQPKDVGGASSGEEQNFEFNWNNGHPNGTDICTNVSVWKFFDASSDESMADAGVNQNCPAGIECTVITSRGYNKGCNELGTLKTVERELFVRY